MGWATAFLFVGAVTQAAWADDFLWLPQDSNDGLWGTTANWLNAANYYSGEGSTTVTFPPSSADDIAIIGYSNTQNITLDSDYNIDSLAVGGSGPEPTIGTDYLGTSEVLTLSGEGLIGNPYSDSPITAGTIGLFGTGSLQLTNSASLGFVGVDNYSTLVFAGSSTAGTAIINNHGLISFENDSSGDESLITNDGTIQLLNNATLGPGTGIFDNAGTLNLYDSSDTDTRSINNEGGQQINFHDESSADDATIHTDGAVNFFDSATAASSDISTGAVGSAIHFYNDSTAGGATLDNYTTMSFNDSSDAGTAQLTNHGFSAALNFNDDSSAAESTITNGGSVSFHEASSAGSASLSNSGTVDFYDDSTAGSSVITGNGFDRVTFHNNSTAGEATITSLGPDSITFEDNATGGTATLNNLGTGTLAFSNMANAGSAPIDNEGSLLFEDNASAGQSTITNHGTTTFSDFASAGSSIIINKGLLYLEDQSSASNASINNSHSDSVVDISYSAGGTSIGELSGSGFVDLGSNVLTVGALGTDATFSGDIQDGGGNPGTGGSLIKVGAGTLTLTGGNDFTGGTTVQAGTLEVDSSGDISDYSNLHMQGGIFHYYNPATSGGTNGQIFGQLTFEDGASEVGSVLGAGNAAGVQTYLVVDQLNPRLAGATGNFTTSNFSSMGQTAIVIGTGTGSIVSNHALNTSVEHAAGFLDPGIFYNGNSYAWYDPVGNGGAGVRAINYNGDAGAYTTGATSSISTSPDHQYVQTTGAVSAQQSGDFATLNLASADNFMLASGATLSLEGILGSASGASTIGGGAAIQATDTSGDGNELTVYTAQGDVLTIDTPILADVLTKSGAGTLNLNQPFSGQVYFNQGSIGTSSTINGNVAVNHSSLNLGATGMVNGNVNVGAGGTFSGSGTVNGKVTVAGGGSTFPGDPQVTSASSLEYQSGSAAQFSIATTGGSSHPPVPGVDYDQIQLTGGPGPVLQIDPGTTTLQLNFSTASLAAVQANAENNINDLYFVFNLGSGTSSGQFSELTLTVGANTYTDAINAGVADVSQVGLQFDTSYTASESGDSLSGGNDIAFAVGEIAAAPEPSTWALLLGGLGMLACFRPRARRPEERIL